MDQDDCIFRSGSRPGEAGVIAHADVHHVRSDAAFGSRRRPPDGNKANRKGRGRKDFEVSVTFGPAVGNCEFFGMYVVNARATESLHSPVCGAVG